MENHEVTNQFNVFGSLKPGRLRLWIVRFLLRVTGYAARHLYHRGNLARVSHDSLCTLGFDGRRAAHAVLQHL